MGENVKVFFATVYGIIFIIGWTIIGYVGEKVKKYN